MATFAHPGVYIEEFTPGSPIEGVGTSTAAFIGTATSGPIETPTRIHSWDEFKTVFGDHKDERPRSWLPLAVQGFFANGGTDCFIVRVSTAVAASAALPTVNQPGDPVLVVTAKVEGTAAPPTTVTVTHTSLLASGLGAAGPALKVARQSTDVGTVDAERRTVTVTSNSGFAEGDSVLFEKGTGASKISHPAEIASLEGEDKLVLTRAIPPTLDFTGGGTVRIADLDIGTTRVRLTVPSDVRLTSILPPGSTVQIDTTTKKEFRVVAATAGDSVTLDLPLEKKHDLSVADVEVTSLEFDLLIESNTTVETYPLRSMNPAHPNWWGNIESEIVTIAEPATPPTGTITDPRPKAVAAGTTYTLGGAQDDHRAVAWANLNSTPKPALDLLAPYDDVAIVAIPGAYDKTVHQELLSHCETLRDRVAILDSKPGDTPDQAVLRAQDATGRNLGFGALYYPWIEIMNPAARRPELWPPSGHLAGIYADTDTRRGVHKAPANVTIRGALGLEHRLTDAEQDVLNPKGVNALRILPGSGVPRVWGARTTTIQDRNWQYVNIRRLFLYLEESIQEGIQWAVFEPNDLALWQKLRRTITEFLTRVWRDGALFGAKASDAFYVRVDDALNPESTRKLGRLYLEIGVVPVYPAEVIVVRIGIWDRGSEVIES